MTPIEAAKIIGCSPSHCRELLRTGKIPCKIIVVGDKRFYDVTKADAMRFKRAPKTDQRGFPRGAKRNRKGKKVTK